ncbi:dnaK protein [Histomonas meleagridis]|uniref:dnaK protein n=1 Tax=Histomonas meleagridis TaxID=135588 RepID=UPI00355A5239|nr:dnaK protein [Histomonas meleagridis]KAH0797389.1 dnaK protein [Histomonas meleagridis]
MLFLLSLALTVRNDSYAIDFGSFYTKSGNLSEDGNPSILFNLQTKRLTPTFLAFRTPKTYNPSLLLNSEILSHFQCEIGEDAMNLITKNSWTGTGFFPSLIGLMNSATNSLIQNLGFPFSANSTFGLLNMSSAYLHFYSKFVFGTIPQEVTVVYPSFYSVTQSTILLNLLKSAGFRSPKLISDIESIASFYVHEKIDLFRNIPQTILFIDVGATSVKSYVMEFSNTPNGIVVTQLSYGFDLSIGGSYATNSLVKHLIRELKLQNITESDRMKLFQASEKIKQQLSLLQETHQQIPNINGKDYSVTVTRNDFEEMIIDFVVNTTNIALSSRGRIPINQIELLGGSARIPKIQESLSKAFQGIKIELIW